MDYILNPNIYTKNDISNNPQEQEMNEYIQKYYFIKQNVEEKEEALHSLTYNALHKYIHIPKIYSYDKKTKILIMAKIQGMNLADMYGEKFEDIPTKIQQQVREIIRHLYYYNIEYPDITGYNFIEESQTGNIWIVDFGHANYTMKRNEYDKFILDFIEGKIHTWNPEFE